MKTLEQIKKHFENAKLVRCLEWGDYKIKRKSIYADKYGNYWAKCKWTTDQCCLYQENRFAEILKSKKSISQINTNQCQN